MVLIAGGELGGKRDICCRSVPAAKSAVVAAVLQPCAIRYLFSGPRDYLVTFVWCTYSLLLLHKLYIDLLHLMNYSAAKTKKKAIF